MLPVRIHAVWFSATGTTKKTVTRIARRLADALGAVYEEYDYTLPAARQQVLTIPAGELAVVGCPTYAGRVPNLLMPYLRDMVRGSGALAAASDIIGAYGPDSRIGRTAAVMLGSTETTFYVLAVYFGACGVRRSRWAIPAAIAADLTGFLVAAALVRWIWGA